MSSINNKDLALYIDGDLEKIGFCIGRSIQKLRISLGLSRQTLAKKIGVTHQQLQKYERGINRISVGRLVLIARALNKPISYFFEDIEDNNSEGSEALPTYHQRMCIEVARNFMRIKQPEHQNAVSVLVRTLATHTNTEEIDANAS